MQHISQLLLRQTEETQKWVNKIIIDVPEEKWFSIPPSMGSSIAWQLGHITVSQFYYTVVLVSGFHPAFAQRINLQEYSRLFANGKHAGEIEGVITRKEILNHWYAQQELTIEILQKLVDHQLSEPVIPHKPHPFVHTKQQSIEWNSRHTMWHCGQIGVIRRMLGNTYDFGFEG